MFKGIFVFSCMLRCVCVLNGLRGRSPGSAGSGQTRFWLSSDALDLISDGTVLSSTHLHTRLGKWDRLDEGSRHGKGDKLQRNLVQSRVSRFKGHSPIILTFPLMSFVSLLPLTALVPLHQSGRPFSWSTLLVTILSSLNSYPS